MTSIGSKQNTIKERNRALVLKSILNSKLNTRAEISRKLGLTKTTLTNIVGELIEDGVITERVSQEEDTNSELPSMLGRKAIGLDVADTAPVILGMLIQRNKIYLIISDISGEILYKVNHTYKGLLSVEEFEKILVTLYEDVKQNNKRRIMAVGISSIGPVNIVEGKMLNPHNFFKEDINYNIAKYVEGMTGLPVYLSNDATAGAMAEKLFSKGREESNFIYISTYKGVGAGLFLDNKLYNGEIGQNGEIGHMSINFMGPKCACGNNGCLEMYADIEKIIEKHSEFERIYPDHVIFNKEIVSILDLLQLIDDGDTLSMSIINDYCEYLSFAVANLITQLNVNLIILSGSNSTQNDFFEKTLESKTNKRSFMSKYEPIKVVKSDFGLLSPLYGSIGIILDKLYSGQIYID